MLVAFTCKEIEKKIFEFKSEHYLEFLSLIFIVKQIIKYIKKLKKNAKKMARIVEFSLKIYKN